MNVRAHLEGDLGVAADGLLEDDPEAVGQGLVDDDVSRVHDRRHQLPLQFHPQGRCYPAGRRDRRVSHFLLAWVRLG